MSSSVLGGVSLGYQLVWNALRQVAAVQLFVSADEAGSVDAPHLLNALDEAWSVQAPQLLLSVDSPRLLCELLAHASASSAWIEVSHAHLHDPPLIQRVIQAHQRGARLVWRGAPGQRPNAALAHCFLRPCVTLTAEEALSGLRVSLRSHQDPAAPAIPGLSSPVVAGDLYESVASRVLAEHCLDEQGAWGVVGWPMEDVLHGYRHQQIQPAQRSLTALLQAIDADDATEEIEKRLSEEPILVYRFLRFVNSAGVGLRSEIQSLRHGLMVLGLSRLRSWLMSQLPRGSSDLNLQPPRTALVMRASLMSQLLNAGESDDLRREVYLCGLMSQIDLLLGESLAAALARIPLPSRITAAILSQDGPYQPSLALAIALESAPTAASRALCDSHQRDREEINRALLRSLTQARLRPAKGLLLV